MKTFKQFLELGKKAGNHLFGSCVGKSDAAGGCAIASYALHKHLQSKGKDSHFVLGYYNKKGEHNNVHRRNTDQHAWVISKNKIIDVTHRQFDKKLPINVTHVNDPRYKEFRRNDAAIKYINRHWDPDAKPTKKVLKSLTENINVQPPMPNSPTEEWILFWLTMTQHKTNPLAQNWVQRSSIELNRRGVDMKYLQDLARAQR